MSPQRVLLEQKHTRYRYVDMWVAASTMLELARSKEEGAWYARMGAVCFCAFCLEGFLNHAGSDSVDWWHDVERKLDPKAKLRIVAERFGVKIDQGARPWQSFFAAFRARNLMAHPRTEVSISRELGTGGEDWPPRARVELELEGATTQDAVERVHADTRAIVETLWTSMGQAGSPFLVSGMSSGDATLI